MKIEIVTTSNKELKETGFGALKACHSVLDSINKQGHDVKLSVCDSLQDLAWIAARKPDFVILAVKYIPVENGSHIWLSEYFAEREINYSGSPLDVLKFDSDKVRAKTHLLKKGVKTAKFFTATPGQYKSESELPVSFPLFLKPLDAANGNGVDDLSLVTNFAEFESKTRSLYAGFNEPVLAEEYLDGREYTVAIIKTEDSKLIISAVEIVPPQSTKGMRILGKKAKQDDSETILKIDDPKVLLQVTRMAADAFSKLGAWDFGRIDIKTNKRGHCYFMEANLVPGMTSGTSYFPRACEIANGLSYDEVIQLIVEKGISRAPYAEPLLIPIVIADNAGEKCVAAM